MIELKLHKASSKGLKLIGMCLPFVLLGIWMIFASPQGSENYIMGWVGTCFLGLGIPIGIFQLLDRRPQTIINEIGIWDRSTKQKLIKWEQIIDAYPMDLFDQKYISIVTDSTFVFSKKPSKLTTKLNEAIGAQNLNLHISKFNIEVNKLNKLIHNLKNADRNDRPKIIQAFKLRPKTKSLSRYLKIPLYILISIVLLKLSLTGITAFMTIMIIMGLAALTAQWYWGSTEESVIRKYAEIIAWFGLINIVLCLVSLKAYDYVSENVGLKLSTEIEEIHKLNSSYPADFNSVKEKVELNLLEEIFANRVQYLLTDSKYELRTVNLLNRERSYDPELKEWNKKNR